ncbi:MAG: extracellular solute-binding protein [Cellulosilyticum sp.]|nr:extracellular solute-binding protein [Cellulosilyticum sp.]
MCKRYIIALASIILCLIFVWTYFLMSNHKTVEITPMAVFNQKEQITFMSSWGAYDSRAAKIKKIFNQLDERYGYLDIEDASIAGAEFLFILKTDFANGNDPNIFGLWPGSDFNLLVEEGKVADLTDLLMNNPSWYSLFKETTWDTVTVDERIYGLPIELIYEGLFINRDLFEAYQVKIPTNYEELLEAIKIFRANNIIPIAYNQTAEGSYIYQNMVMKLGGKEDVENPFDEDGKLKPCFCEGMYYMKELYELGAFPTNWYSLDDKSRNELFLDKKAAMIVQGSWLIGENVLDSNDITVEVVPFPDMPNGKADSTAIIYGCGNGIFHMSSAAWEDTRLRDHCITILKELTSPSNVAILAEDAGFISNIDLGQYAPEETIMGKKGDDLIARSNELVGAVDWYINRNIWENLIIKKFSSILRGTLTPEALCKQVEEAMIQQKAIGEITK